jgi:hypothetical protein
LIGNVVTPRLVIEEGVAFNGRCEIVEDKDRLEKIKQEHLAARSAESEVKPASLASARWTGLQEQNLSTPRVGSREEEKRFTPRVEQRVT